MPRMGVRLWIMMGENRAVWAVMMIEGSLGRDIGLGADKDRAWTKKTAAFVEVLKKG